MTRIGATVVVDGELTSSEPLRIDGRARGRVTSRDGDLTIGPTAAIDADVHATRVTVLGRLKGAIVASERIELGPSADVSGSLSANRVVILDGARFNGRIDMAERTIAAKIAEYQNENRAPK